MSQGNERATPSGKPAKYRSFKMRRILNSVLFPPHALAPFRTCKYNTIPQKVGEVQQKSKEKRCVGTNLRQVYGLPQDQLKHSLSYRYHSIEFQKMCFLLADFKEKCVEFLLQNFEKCVILYQTEKGGIV